MKGETYIKKLSLNKEITLLKEQNIKNEHIINGVTELIVKNKEVIEKLKENNGHQDPNKIQTISVLRDITFELEMLMDIK